MAQRFATRREPVCGADARVGVGSGADATLVGSGGVANSSAGGGGGDSFAHAEIFFCVNLVADGTGDGSGVGVLEGV